jgi:hypothetical protein
VTGAAIVSFAAVSVGLLLWFVGVPLWLWPRTGAPPLERVLYALVTSAGLWLGLGYLLALVSSIELATLMLLLAVVVAMRTYVRTRRDAHGQKAEEQRQRRAERTAQLLDAMDPGARHSLAAIVRQEVQSLLATLRTALVRAARPYNVLSVAAILAILSQSIASVSHQYAPATPDGLTQLLAEKTLALNMGIYSLGTYPVGLPLIVAVVSTVFFSDPLQILRFIGPWISILLPLSAALCAGAMADSGWAGFSALVLTGLTFWPAIGFGSGNVWLPLSTHLATAFVVLSLAFSVRFLRRQENLDIWAAASAAFAAAITQPLVAPLTILLPLLLTLPSITHTPRTWALPAMTAAASLVGLLPLLAGVATGHPLVQTLIVPLAGPGGQVPAGLSGPFAEAGLGGAAIAIGWTALRIRIHPSGDASLFGGVALVIAGLVLATVLPLPVLWRDVLQFGDVVGSLAVPLMLGWGFSLVEEHSGYPRAAAGLTLVLVAGSIIGAARPGQSLPLDATPGAAQAVTRIADNFPAYAWTAVSPVDQYSVVLGKGWHVELVTFLRKVPLAEARDSAFRLDRWRPLRIETPDTFLFVPLREQSGERPTAQDLLHPLPPENSLAYTGRAGLIVDAHAAAWAKAFLQSHPREAHVYWRTQDLLVLWIHQ